MARVLTFSRFFPAYHPNKGKPTYFVEKIWKCLFDNGINVHSEIEGRYNEFFPCTYSQQENIHFHKPKKHTIRFGKRWKVGDKFSPRVWSGKPYFSKQVQIASDIEIVKVYDFEIKGYQIIVDGNIFYHQHVSKWHSNIEELSTNDGLSTRDLFDWFELSSKTDFSGQIIVWDKTVNY